MIELRHMDIRERLHNLMWLHRFDVVSLSFMSGRNNMRYKYYRFVSAYAYRVSDAFVASCATVP